MGAPLPLGEVPVTVLVATHDRPAALARCLAHLAVLRPAPAEIIVLDNGPGAAPVAESLAASVHPIPLRVVQSERLLGVPDARQALLEVTATPLALILDDDAVLPEPTALRLVSDHFAACPRSAVLAFAIEDHRTTPPRRLAPRVGRTSREAPDIRRAGYFIGGAHALRRAAVANAGGYQARFAYAQAGYAEEELDLSYRLVEAGYELHFAPTLVALHLPAHADTRPTPERLRNRVRDRLQLAWRYHSMPYALTFAASWSAFFLWQAVRHGHSAAWLAGIRDGLAAIRHSPRTPLSRSAVRYLRRHGGRLWW